MNIIQGNCWCVMCGMPDNSVDSIVTDPPYGLSFMGKKWDYDVPSVMIWQQCLRVLKPGGFLLSFAGTRTHHRMCCNIEDAGFEIRDMIAWIYGSGFPKSLNIGKAIDKHNGVDVKKIGHGERETINAMGNGLKNRCDVCGKPFFSGNPCKCDRSYKAQNDYQGWGTALKPALEPITVARKPLSEKTVAKNVLKWGTGGMNIDGCRVEGKKPSVPQPKGSTGDIYGFKNGSGRSGEMSDNTQGRFPANLIHDGSQIVMDLFPTAQGCKPHLIKSTITEKNKITGFDEGNNKSASRFFYCAKASKKDRDGGLDGRPTKTATELTGRKEGSKGLVGSDEHGNSTNPFANGGGVEPRKNTHPTVKPTNLMRYLCRLVTPVGGVILDPFVGSGSTGKGAVLEGFDFVGIERDAEYIAIAKARIDSCK